MTWLSTKRSAYHTGASPILRQQPSTQHSVRHDMGANPGACYLLVLSGSMLMAMWSSVGLLEESPARAGAEAVEWAGEPMWKEWSEPTDPLWWEAAPLVSLSLWGPTATERLNCCTTDVANWLLRLWHATQLGTYNNRIVKPSTSATTIPLPQHLHTF